MHSQTSVTYSNKYRLEKFKFFNILLSFINSILLPAFWPIQISPQISEELTYYLFPCYYILQIHIRIHIQNPICVEILAGLSHEVHGVRIFVNEWPIVEKYSYAECDKPISI